MAPPKARLRPTPARVCVARALRRARAGASARASRHQILSYVGTTALIDHVTDVAINSPAAIGLDHPVTFDAVGN